MTKGISETGEF